MKWEKSANSKVYAILYNQMLEVFSVDSETPTSTCVFDTLTASFDFVGASDICVADIEGNLLILSNILSEETISLRLVKTKFPRFREVKSCFNQAANDNQGEYSFVATISTDCKVGFWSLKRLLDGDQDLELNEMKADRVIKSKNRLTCLAINNLDDYFVKHKLLGKRSLQEQESQHNQSSSDESPEQEDSPEESGEDSIDDSAEESPEESDEESMVSDDSPGEESSSEEQERPMKK